MCERERGCVYLRKRTIYSTLTEAEEPGRTAVAPMRCFVGAFGLGDL